MTSMPCGLKALPALLEGEDLNSFIERVGGYSGMPSLLVATQKLLKRPRAAIAGMPNGIQTFHDVLGYLYGPVDMFITDHTLWRLYCNGLPEDSYDEQRKRLLHKLPGPIHMARPPILYGVGALVNVQCPVCEETALKNNTTYFHRRLAVPYASVCPIHKIALRTVGEQMRIFDQHCSGQPNAYQFEMAWQLSTHMEYCLDTPPEFSKFNRRAVIHSLTIAGWIGENGRLHLQQFVATFIDFFDEAFADARLALLCQSPENVNNALRALLRPGHSVFPVWCILFVWFAEQCPRPISHVTPHRTPERTIRETVAEPKYEELEVALAENGSLKAASLALKMSRQKLTALCRQFDLPVTWRAKKIDESLRSAIYEALKNGMSSRDAIEFFGISLSTLYREMAAWPELLLPGRRKRLEHIQRRRSEWEQLLDANPGKSETCLRKLNPAAWTVLNRNDHSWLLTKRPLISSTQPRKKKEYCVELAAKLDSALTEASTIFSAEDSKPVRKSKYSLRKSAGITEYQLNRLTAEQLVKSHEEPRDSYIQRRIARAEKNGALQTQPHWIFARAAGLREETIRRFMNKR